MNKFQCVCFTAVIFLNFYSGICKPIVNIDEEVIFDPRHPVLTHVNSSIPTVENKGDNVPLNVTEGKSQRTRKNKAKGSKVVKTDPEKIEKSKDPIKEDEFLEKATPSLEDRINRPNEKDKEHEKFCEELCSSCKGSENVFDLAEPSCFCKVVTVKSVKCLEDKVTEDYPMKVIAYVETDPKSEEEKLVSQYLKEREELSLNRNKRCCGNVGAASPKLENMGTPIGKSRNPKVYESIENEENLLEDTSYPEQYDRLQLNAHQNNRQLDFDDEEYDVDQEMEGQYGDADETTDDELLGARKITAGPGLEKLWRKALRADDTSPEREEESSEVTEKPIAVKRNKKSDNRGLYRYEPPASYKPLLGQKQKKVSEATEADQQPFKSKESQLGISKPSKLAFNNIVGESLKDPDDDSRKKSKKISKTIEKPIQEEKKSIKELFSERKLQSKKQSDDEPRKDNKYKSLDDILYEQELKRQKILTSIQEKYANIPEQSSKIEKSESDGIQKDDVVIKTKNKKKKYSENYAGILGSKSIIKPNQVKEDINNKKSNTVLKLKIPKDENFKVNNKRKSKSSQGDEDLKESEKPKKVISSNGQILGEKASKRLSYPGKPIVSPFIDDRFKKRRDDNSSNLKNSQSEKKSVPNLFRSSLKSKEYLEKDNELGGASKNKESIASLISKIRAKYDKNEREITKGKEKPIVGSKILGSVENTKSLSSSLLKDKDNKGPEKGKSTKNSVPKATILNSKDDKEIEKIHNDNKPTFKSKKISTKHVLPIEDKLHLKDGKILKASNNLKSKSVNSNVKSDQIIIPCNENNLEEPTANYKYLKAKYSGVKPNLIKEEKLLGSTKSVTPTNTKNKKDTIKVNEVSSKYNEDETEISSDNNLKDLKTKYLQKKEELLQKIAERENERSNLKAVLGSQRTGESRSIDTNPPQENAEDDDIENSDEHKLKDTLKSKYLQRKEELLQKIAEREHERANSKPLLAMQETIKSPSIEINPSQEDTEESYEIEKPDDKNNLKTKYLQKKEELLQKIAARENVKSDSKAGLGKESTAESRSIEINLPQEVKNEKAFPGSAKVFPGVTREERKKILETALKELSEKKKYANSKQPETIIGIPNDDANLGETIEHEDMDISSQDSDPLCLESKKMSEESQPVLKKPSVKDLIEQKKASRLESIQMKSNEPSVLGTPKRELLGEKQLIPPKQEPPTKFSLKELIGQKKLERQITLERRELDKESNQKTENSSNKESPLVGSSLISDDEEIQTIMDQNPQKHCEQCMKYVNHMSQLQREQILGQKPYSTRSISTKSNQNIASVGNEDQVAQEKFLNCKCYENKADPTRKTTNDNIIGQPMNMKDITEAFENIKTGIESNVKGANEKLVKGYNDMKTSLQNEYEQVSHSDLVESLKDSTNKVAQKIYDLHIKDTVSKELSDISHTLQDKYDSVTNKGTDKNLKDISNTVANTDKTKSELLGSTDAIVSQPAPNRYTTYSQKIVPDNQSRTKYLQANYINPEQQLQATPMSGNANAPINQV